MPSRIARLAGGARLLFLAMAAPAAGADRGPVPVARGRVAPGIFVRVRKTPAPPAIVVERKRATLTFTRFFTDPRLFTHAELNENRYQSGRGYWSPNAYELFGLATYQRRVYVGVAWYSEGASGQPSGPGAVFRLEWKDGRLVATPLQTIPGFQNRYAYGEPGTRVPASEVTRTLARPHP